MSVWKICILLIIIWSICAYLKQFNKELLRNKQYKYGILMCCHDRPEYLHRTLDSLKKTNMSDLEQSIIYIIDDHSTNEETIKLIKEYTIDKVKIEKTRSKKNMGINQCMLSGYTFFHQKCEFIMNIDSDVLVQPDWITKLHSVYEKSTTDMNITTNKVLVGGFNCIPPNCAHKIISTTDTYHVKKSIGGINMFFHRDFGGVICSIIKGSHRRSDWDWLICCYCRDNNVPIIVTKPSVVQHIGFSGLNSSGKQYDYADDFLSDLLKN